MESCDHPMISRFAPDFGGVSLGAEKNSFFPFPSRFVVSRVSEIEALSTFNFFDECCGASRDFNAWYAKFMSEVRLMPAVASVFMRGSRLLFW